MPRCEWGYVPSTSATITYGTDTSNSAWVIWNDQWYANQTATVWTNWNAQLMGCSNQNAATQQYANQQAAGLGQGLGSMGANQQLYNQQAARAVTPDEYAAILARDTERQAQLAAEAERRKQATERARQLLVAMLDREQQEEFAKNRSFIVHTKDRQRRYQVTYGTAGNVLLLNPAGQTIAKFCIHPEEEVPTPDVMLAQKLLLETDEQQFLKIANKTVIRNESAVA